MENTLENKAKFFAQYCGQEVFRYFDNLKIQEYFKLDYENFGKIHNGYLELKPLSSITDEDALTYIGLGYNGYLNVIITEKHNDGVSFEYEYKSSKRRRIFSYRFNYVSQYAPNVAQLDFLRSKGYALPWMNLNIDTLEKYGWIKLKEN